MTRSEYLFGHPPEKYAEYQEPLAKDKIADAKTLLSVLQKQISYDPKDQDENQLNVQIRLAQVAEALTLWRKIDEDGKV